MAFWFCLCSIYYLLLLVTARRKRRHTEANGFPGLMGESLLCWTRSYLLSRFIRDRENGAGSQFRGDLQGGTWPSEKRAPLMRCSAAVRLKETRCRYVCLWLVSQWKASLPQPPPFHHCPCSNSLCLRLLFSFDWCTFILNHFTLSCFN